MLFHGQSPALHCRHISGRIMRVCPSLRPRKRMCPSPKSQVRLAAPVFQVMLRFKSRLCPIRNLVVMIPRGRERLLRHLIKLRHFILARHRPGAVLPPAVQQLLPEPAALINLQQINRNMLRRQRRQFFQRLPPAFLRLVRQTRNQIKADIPNPRLAQYRNRPVNIRPPVHPPRRNQFPIHERLQPKTNPVDSRPDPSRRLLGLNSLRVRLQRHLFDLPGAFPARCLQQLLMLPNLPANHLHIRRKPATAHYSRMKVAVGALRLAERHLHVDSELLHHPKTLAHTRCKTLNQRTLSLVSDAKSVFGKNGWPSSKSLADLNSTRCAQKLVLAESQSQSDTTLTCSRRSRGPSNSQKNTPCQRPNISLPPSTWTIWLAPTNTAFPSDSHLPSLCRYGPAMGISRSSAPSTSRATSGSAHSVMVIAAVV